MEEAEANDVIVPFMTRVADHMKGLFPHHASALRGEVIGVRMTGDRWHRVSYVLASLHAVPGVPLAQHEHDVRNVVLSTVMIAKKMAGASFGSRRPQEDRELAVWRARELEKEMR